MEIKDEEILKKKCNEQLDAFNNAYPNSKLTLVLFKMAINHIIRIVRVISNPNGHVLLVGVGGSGRKSLTTVATFIAH